MAHKELEIRVNERTEELIKVNETLLGEITERKRMEEELRKSEEQYPLIRAKRERVCHCFLRFGRLHCEVE